MTERKRLYHQMIQDHLMKHRQMAFVSGPRQVGKTTVCRSLSDQYWSWDNFDKRRFFMEGPARMAQELDLQVLGEKEPVVTFDELHKYSKWKALLKGFFDSYEDQIRIIVTGSSRLDVFRKGGDSLMGRYFLYRMHPWSVAECLHTDIPTTPVRSPRKIKDEDWQALLRFGGFPEPFLKRDPSFSRRWQSLRFDQLSKEDLREVTRVENLAEMEVLMHILSGRSGNQLIYSGLSKEINVAVDTIRRWIDLLERLQYGFVVRPWYRNVSRALRKEPKWFLRDWSVIKEDGARAETLAACHLLKAVEGWTDLGLGKFELRYLRDKLKREVDFLVIRDGSPWFLVEVKMTNTHLSPALGHFQKATKAPHAFQVVMNLPYVAADCFVKHDPVVVPAKTFFSQLL